MKLLVWNINQRSSGKEIPPFVSEMIMDFNTDADIVVLTEFLSAANANSEKIKKFKDSLSKKYYTFCNEKRDKEREKANGIFIAVKKGFAEINGAPNEDLKTDCKEEDQPNFLQLDIVVEGKPISIIGTRIQVGGGVTRSAYIESRLQLISLVEHLVKLGNKNIIVAGDFNNAKIRGDEAADYLTVRDNYRGKVTFDTYNYHIMKGIFATAGLTVFTPPGEQYSYGFKLDRDGKLDNGRFKEDHIVTKNLKVENSKYCHSFIENYKIDKEWERRWNRRKKKYEYVIVEAYPDHAILTADVDFLT
jgi:endonuclease/exonuclease/phosphatase family metal-dependent hydrolase